MRTQAQWLQSIRVVVAAVPLVAVCCPYQAPPPPYRTPPPPFATRPVEAVPWDSVRAYAQTLRFDTVLYAADEKRVVFDTSRLGAHIADAGDSARIEPELGAWALDTNTLAEGRIIARIKTAHFHPVWGYGPAWTWWWVERRGAQWRSLYLSDSLRKAIPASLHVTIHRDHLWRQSLARWGSQWGTCSSYACCEGGPPQTQ